MSDRYKQISRRTKDEFYASDLTKICHDCKKDLHVSNYYLRFNKKYGHYYPYAYCKTCMNRRKDEYCKIPSKSMDGKLARQRKSWAKKSATLSDSYIKSVMAKNVVKVPKTKELIEIKRKKITILRLCRNK